MIEVFARTVDGRRLKLPYITSLQFWQEEDTPADLLTLGVFMGSLLPELVTLEALADGERFFNGIVDEQITRGVGDYFEMKLVARGAVALLLDNQARPQLYEKVSLKELLARHVEPYGFAWENLPEVAVSNFLVRRGMSEWEVLCQFCHASGVKLPTVLLNNTLEFKNSKTPKMVKFAAQGGESFCDINFATRRCGCVSRVFVKHGCDYELSVPDLKATGHGVQRKRYVEVPVKGRQEKIECVQRYLKERNKQGFLVNVLVPKIIRVAVGDFATLEYKGMQFEKLLVSGVKFEKNRLGNKTHVKLREL